MRQSRPKRGDASWMEARNALNGGRHYVPADVELQVSWDFINERHGQRKAVRIMLS